MDIKDIFGKVEILNISPPTNDVLVHHVQVGIGGRHKKKYEEQFTIKPVDFGTVRIDSEHLGSAEISFTTAKQLELDFELPFPISWLIGKKY